MPAARTCPVSLALGCFEETDTLHMSHRSWMLLILRAACASRTGGCWGIWHQIPIQSEMDPAGGITRPQRRAQHLGCVSTGSLLLLFFLVGFPSAWRTRLQVTVLLPASAAATFDKPENKVKGWRGGKKLLLSNFNLQLQGCHLPIPI